LTRRRMPLSEGSNLCMRKSIRQRWFGPEEREQIEYVQKDHHDPSCKDFAQRNDSRVWIAQLESEKYLAGSLAGRLPKVQVINARKGEKHGWQVGAGGSEQAAKIVNDDGRAKVDQQQMHQEQDGVVCHKRQESSRQEYWRARRRLLRFAFQKVLIQSLKIFRRNIQNGRGCARWDGLASDRLGWSRHRLGLGRFLNDADRRLTFWGLRFYGRRFLDRTGG